MVDLSWEHRNNDEIKKLKSKQQYWIKKRSKECEMFDE